ncbi:MAG: hypothetical protein E4H10_14755 [Bacteroidia bacterium]|nr:MAG: hypothetical protein E4H10_14755 [Bacteroidia bacterium]
MKSLVRVFLLTVLATGIASCSLLDVEKDVEFAATLNINVEDPVVKSTGGVGFAVAELVDPSTNDVVDEYGDLIENYDVSEIVAVVRSVSEAGVVFLAGSTFSIYQGNKSATWSMGTDYPAEVANIFEMTDLGDAYGVVADILLTGDPFYVAAVGETNVGNVSISMEVTIKSRLTANPLN